MRYILNLIRRILLFHIKFIYGVFLFFFLLLVIAKLMITNEESKPINYEYVKIGVSNITDDRFSGSDIFGEKSISLYQLIETINDLRFNLDVKGIIIDADNIELSSSKTEELIKALEKFKNSGKKIYTYGLNLDNNTYKLASISNEIVMGDTVNSRISLGAYYNSNLYFKNLFDKYGIEVEAIHIGDYKSYGENYYLNKMSKELRDSNERILENRFNKFVSIISKNRGIESSKLEKNILDGKFDSISSYTAMDNNLITKVKDYDEFMDEIGSTKENTVNIEEILGSKYSANIKNDIAIINLEGVVSKQGNVNPFYISEDIVNRKLEKVKKNKNVKAVILRINSPGGDALQAELIHKAITKFKKNIKIPIYASISDVAASGGYYIATSADKIFANEASITGSIGVVSLMTKFAQTVSMYDINNSVIEKGKFAGIYNPLHTLTDEDRQHIQETLLDIYKEFKDRVSTSRGIKDEDLEKIAGGRIWLGDEAKNINLVDEILSLDEVIDYVANENKLLEYNVIEYNFKLDYSRYIDEIKSFIISDNIKIVDKLLSKLDFLKENNGKALYYDYTLENLKFY